MQQRADWHNTQINCRVGVWYPACREVVEFNRYVLPNLGIAIGTLEREIELTANRARNNVLIRDDGRDLTIAIPRKGKEEAGTSSLGSICVPTRNASRTVGQLLRGREV
jgi:hypothetical protein